MRILSIIVVLLLFSSCGEESETSVVDTTDHVAPVDTSVFAAAREAVATLELPAMIKVDSLSGYSLSTLDEHDAYELLPGEFEFGSYNSVACFAQSVVGDKSILWFRMTSDSDYEDAPDDEDIIMVMYGADAKPIDVYSVSYSSIGYSYSYVRNDSIFTVDVDEMENTNITTTSIAIASEGFIPQPSETRTFEPGQKAASQSKEYIDQYFISKKK